MTNTATQSPTLELASAVRQMRRDGKVVVDLGIGQLNLDTPGAVQLAAFRAILNGKTRYTAVEGNLDLREAVLLKHKCHRDPGCVVISNGAKQSLFNFIKAVVEPGSEVLVQAPYWNSYIHMIQCAGGTARIVPIKGSSFDLNLPELRALITSKTRVLLLNSPSNPTGFCLSRQTLQMVADIVRTHAQMLVLSDEIYSDLIYEEPYESFLSVAPDLAERTCVVHGVSKSYAMTGWRIGYSISNAEIARKMKAVQSHVTSGACSISQEAALCALKECDSFIEDIIPILRARRDLICSKLQEDLDIKCLSKIGGGFYVFADFSCWINSLGFQSDSQFSAALLEQLCVATVPGSAFGAPGFLRLSFGSDIVEIEKGLSWLVDGLKGKKLVASQKCGV